MSNWIIVYKSEFPNLGNLKCECDKCGKIEYGDYKDYRWSDDLHYELPKFCSECGDKKDNTYIKV